MKQFVERPLTEAERAQFLRDMADTAPYLEPISTGEWVTVKLPQGVRKGSRAARKKAKRR